MPFKLVSSPGTIAMLWVLCWLFDPMWVGDGAELTSAAQVWTIQSHGPSDHQCDAGKQWKGEVKLLLHAVLLRPERCDLQGTKALVDAAVKKGPKPKNSLSNVSNVSMGL